MAEAIVYMANNGHADPTKDRRGCWKRGMIIEVKPNGFKWGREVDPRVLTPPRRFLLLRFPGVSVDRLVKYLEVEPLGNGMLASPNDPDYYRRRVWQLQHAELPATVRTQIALTGVLTVAPSGGDVTWEQLRGFLMRLDTRARESAELSAG